MATASGAFTAWKNYKKRKGLMGLRKTIILVLVFVIGIAAFLTGCKQTPQQNKISEETEPSVSTTVEPSSATTDETTKKVSADVKKSGMFKPSFSKLDFYVKAYTLGNYRVSLIENDMDVYYGLKIRNISSGHETVIRDSDVSYALFNTNQVIYTVTYNDPSVKIDSEILKEYDNYFKENDEEKTEEMIYKRSDFYSYNIKTQKTTKLLTAYSDMAEPVYMDDNSLYFVDIKENQIGYKNGFYVYVTGRNLDSMELYKSDFQTGKVARLATVNAGDIGSANCIAHDLGGQIFFTSESYDSLKILDLTGRLLHTFKGKTDSDSFHVLKYSDGSKLYLSEENDKNGSHITLFAYDPVSEKAENLYSYTISEGEYTSYAYNVDKLSLNRYCLCKSIPQKTDTGNEYTMQISAYKAIFFDFVTKKEMIVDISEFDSVYEENGVLYGAQGETEEDDAKTVYVYNGKTWKIK